MDTVRLSEEEIARQLDICTQIGEWNAERRQSPLAFVDTYGCQQNEADSERLRGYLRAMGYGFTEQEAQADVIVINTCAVRGHAEDRVLGNVGALVHTKRKRPGQIICLCGCMMGEPGMVERIRQSYPHVELVFDTHSLWKFPELLQRVIVRRGRVFDTQGGDGSIAEGIPVVRQNGLKAWVSVMYGCNNFCSYCIVPYVRGRERSRRPEDILAEVRELAQAGYKDITLLGQNVNSYGKDLDGDWDFPRLLEEVCAVPGDFLVRFMTSHPKDASQRLFDVMAREPKIAHHLHLPFQCGNDRVLRAMNRGYTAEHYMELVGELRERIPDIVLTSDVIVGFPGETTREFEDTLKLIEAVRFDALFTFIFSPREGTPAASMPDVLSPEEKQANFQRLVDAQNAISHAIHQGYIGKTFRCLIDGEGTDPRNNLTARTNSGRLVHLTGPKEWIGTFRSLRITDATTWALFGTAEEDENR